MRIIILSSIFTVFLSGAIQDDIPRLKWAGPPGSRPGTYEEWIAQHPYTDFSYRLDRVVYGDGRAGTVAILTKQAIAPALVSEIDQLMDNLQSEGYTVLSYEISGGTPDTLRAFLRNLYNLNNLEGALLMGSLPVAWFELYDGGLDVFPCDLYYMDLNGTWLDTLNTGNERFDGHTGDINPEIYIGRIIPIGLGSDSVLIKNYFRKNNAYRHDTLLLTQRALFFDDDDWQYWGPQWAYDLSLLYPDTMNFWDTETTRASVYRTKLDTTQAWVSVFAHSWPGGHQFEYHDGIDTLYDYYYSNEYTNQNPPTNFYNFFACSFCRYTEDCGGNRAIFNQTSGIGAIGSTKAGSMLEFSYFYDPLGQGKTLGTAFKDWFTHITYNGVTIGEMSWHYGMTLLGDPFLKPVGHNVSVTENESDAVSKSIVSVLGNPVSSHIYLNLSLEQMRNVHIELYDCTGRKVNSLIRKLDRGNHTITLSLKSTRDEVLAQGVYILRVKIDQTIITKKIIKM